MTWAWSAMVADMLQRAMDDAGLTSDEVAARIDVDPRTARDMLDPEKISFKGAKVDAWLAACGWDAEIMAGPHGGPPVILRPGRSGTKRWPGVVLDRAIRLLESGMPTPDVADIVEAPSTDALRKALCRYRPEAWARVRKDPHQKRSSAA